MRHASCDSRNGTRDRPLAHPASGPVLTTSIYCNSTITKKMLEVFFLREMHMLESVTQTLKKLWTRHGFRKENLPCKTPGKSTLLWENVGTGHWTPEANVEDGETNSIVWPLLNTNILYTSKTRRACVLCCYLTAGLLFVLGHARFINSTRPTRSSCSWTFYSDHIACCY